MVRLDLSYNTENPYHKDITLIVNGLVNETQDSYFFALDNFILPNEEDWQKVKTVVHVMLKKWRSIINNMSIQTVVYLPFDFSDQYIGCLKVTDLPNNQIAIQYGITTLFDGTTLCPSQTELFNLEPEDFITSSQHKESISVNKQEFIQAIEIVANSINNS